MDFLYFLLPYRTPVLEAFFQLVTYLGQEIFIVAVICWLYWCSNKKLAYTLGFTYFISGLLVQGLKITFRIPRPWVLDPNFQAVPSAIPAATGYSFPSGHTQSSTALFTTLALYVKTPWKKALCILAFLGVGFSRMYLGCHTPKDVLTAMGISAVTACLCYRFFHPRELTRQQDRSLCIIFGILALALMFYAFYLYRSNFIEAKYAQDCFKAAGAGFGFSLGYYIERNHIRFQMPASSKEKLLRLLAGLLVTAVLQEGLKPILGVSLPASFLRYFLVILWVLAIYPYFFTRFSQNRPS
ncbi:MAG: phosphatase PAP2 family protein [Blautia sp.]|jgi:membrane-associated phospholipid phosphatase